MNQDSAEGRETKMANPEMRAEIEALRRRLAAIEEGSPVGAGSDRPARSLWSATIAILFSRPTFIAGALALLITSIVWGQEAVIAFFVDQSGNVGIGTKTPQSTLDVNGGVNINGGLNIKGDVNANGSVMVSNLTVTGTVSASALIGTAGQSLCPPGSIMAYMGMTPPVGWLKCDGTAVSRTDYSSLFAVIGFAAGSGNGTTTFNLPDLRGVFLRGMQDARPVGGDPESGSRTSQFPGGYTGNALGSFQDDQMIAHSHPVGVNAIDTATDVWGKRLPNYVDDEYGKPPQGQTHLFTGLFGGSETRPKNVYVNYIIKY